MKEVVTVPDVAPPFGPYSHAVRTTGGLLFVSGCIALDENGVVVGVGDMAAQTEQCLHNLRSCLQAAGCYMSDVVKLNTYVVGTAAYQDIRPVREKYFQPPYPASTLVGVPELIFPELLIEIEAVCALPS